MTLFPNPSDPALGGLSLMGTPLCLWRKTRAYHFLRKCGLDPDAAQACSVRVAEQYARDQPFEAEKISLTYVDLTGHYMLMAMLLADPDNANQWASAVAEGDPVAVRAPAGVVA